MDSEVKENTPLNNIWAWVIAILPLAVSLIFLGNMIFFTEYYQGVILCSFIVLGICVNLDVKALRDSGYNPPSLILGIIISPVYLWKRASIIGAKKIHFSAWVIALALTFVVDRFSYNDALAKAACPIVTKLLKDNLGTESAECVKVKIKDNVTDNFHKGIATLNNGNDINITIEEKTVKSVIERKTYDMIYVRISNEYLQ